MKIQVLSDLHIEFTHETNQATKNTDIIVLAGDIWHQYHTLDWAAKLLELHD